MFFAFDRSLQI